MKNKVNYRKHIDFGTSCLTFRGFYTSMQNERRVYLSMSNIYSLSFDTHSCCSNSPDMTRIQMFWTHYFWRSNYYIHTEHTYIHTEIHITQKGITTYVLCFCEGFIRISSSLPTIHNKPILTLAISHSLRSPSGMSSGNINSRD